MRLPLGGGQPRDRALPGLCGRLLLTAMLICVSLDGAVGGRRSGGGGGGGGGGRHDDDSDRRQERNHRERLADSDESCARAQAKCLRKVGCYLAMQNYYVNCGSLINGETNVCSMDCKVSLISLLITEGSKGKSLINCDCGGSDFCLEQKQRVEVCREDVVKAIDSINDNTRISCTLAEALCLANTTCMYAMEYYRIHCMRLFRGEKCTPKCNNSLNVLFRNPWGHKIRDCICDGTERYDCHGIQSNTAELCYGCKAKRHHHRRHHHRHCHQSGGGGGGGGGDGDSKAHPPTGSSDRGGGQDRGSRLTPSYLQGDDPYVCEDEDSQDGGGGTDEVRVERKPNEKASTSGIVVTNTKPLSSASNKLSLTTGLTLPCIMLLLSSVWHRLQLLAASS
jgi:growth arrest-specific protein 1